MRRDYRPIGELLKQHGTETVTVTFAQIDAVVVGELPPSARKWNQFWRGAAVNSPTHPWKREWEDAGYTVHKQDLKAEVVTFRRF